MLEAAIADAARAGDTRAEWLARLDRAAFRVVLGIDDELRAVAEQAIEVLTTMQDDAALALAWRRMAFAERRAGRYGASVEPSERAVAHARAAADVYEETRAIDSLCTGLLYGPTPAAEAAERSRMLLGDAKGRPATQANVLASLAELEAMLGHLDAARDAYSRSRAIYEELGLRMPLAGLTTIGAELELLAGDPVAAEAEARRGMDHPRGQRPRGGARPAGRRGAPRTGPGRGGRRAAGRHRGRRPRRPVAGSPADRASPAPLPAGQDGGRARRRPGRGRPRRGARRREPLGRRLRRARRRPRPDRALDGGHRPPATMRTSGTRARGTCVAAEAIVATRQP